MQTKKQSSNYVFKHSKEIVNILEQNLNFDNLSLALDKYILFNYSGEEKQQKVVQVKKISQDIFNLISEKDSNKITKNAINEYISYYQEMLTLWRSVGGSIFELSTCSKLAIGLGISSVYETNLSLLKMYGFPYIPGSAIKGITKNWCILKFADEYKRKHNKEIAVNTIDNLLESEKETNIVNKYPELLKIKIKLKKKKNQHEVTELDIKELRKIFGTKERKGLIVFYNGLINLKQSDDYAVKDVLAIDIMTPHFSDYYEKPKENPPIDWYNPNPITFLVAKENLNFTFCLSLIMQTQKNQEEENLLIKVRSITEEALINYGVGAKTSLGYGRFKEEKL